VQAESGDLAGAVTTVRSVQSPDAESKVRAAVAGAQAKSGDVAGALATARTITGANRVFLAGMLAAYQAKAGDVAGALQTAEAIPEGGIHGGYGLRGAALLGVASAQASRGDLAGARVTAQRITEPSMRELVVVPIARAQAKRDVAAALGLARAVGDPVTRAMALEAVVMVQARATGVPTALQTAKTIAEEPARSAALVGVARVQAERGDGAGAWVTLGSVTDTHLRSGAQRTIALTLARAGDPARLIETARRRGSDAGSRVIALTAAAEDVMRSAEELRQSSGLIFLVLEEWSP